MSGGPGGDGGGTGGARDVMRLISEFAVEVSPFVALSGSEDNTLKLWDLSLID